MDGMTGLLLLYAESAEDSTVAHQRQYVCESTSMAQLGQQAVPHSWQPDRTEGLT
jgi:hypothetical protein